MPTLPSYQGLTGYNEYYPSYPTDRMANVSNYTPIYNPGIFTMPQVPWLYIGPMIMPIFGPYSPYQQLRQPTQDNSPPVSNDDLYQDCDGNTFYPAESCKNERCVAEGLEREIFTEWKRQFMSIHNLSEDVFDTRIEISNVEISGTFCRIDYIFKLDWVRSRQNEGIPFKDYPLNEAAGEYDIERAVSLAIEEAEQFNVPSVVSRSTVEKTFQNCASSRNLSGVFSIDWCNINFQNVSGRLAVRGTYRIGSNILSPSCKLITATVDVATGELIECLEYPCVYN